MAYYVDHGLKRLFYRSFRVETVTVEKVYIVEVHASQALVEACHEIFSRAPVAIGSGPHVVASLGADEQFVAIRRKIILHQSSQGFLCTAIGRSVVVCEVEMRDAVVEGVSCYLTATLIRVYTTEIVPESETYLR